MIDVNKITSTLAKLPDAQLQQYAQMHKSDPYIMALAMSESNRRKELRAADQGSMQEQPKVVDQMVAEMAPQQLPEEMGIGQLPAGNMNFADGGIIAFAGGGDVEHYYGGGSTGDMYDSAKARAAAAQQKLYSYGLRQRQLDPAGFQAAQQELAAAQSVLQTAKQGYESELTATGLNRPAFNAPTAAAPVFQEAPAASAAAPASYNPADNVQKIAQTNAGRITYNAAPKNAEEAALLQRFSPTPKAADAAPKVDTGRKGPGIGEPAVGRAAAAAVPEQSAAQRYAAMQKEMGMGPEAGADLEWRRSQMADRMRAQSKGELEEFEKDVAARGEAFKGREERLAKREAGLGKMKDETTGLALLEAGLAIMSTPGGLATAIGKGAQSGLKTYGAGLEKLRAAQEKMDDARDQIEEFRRNEANMTAKERRQFKSAINRTETEVEKLSLDAAEKMFGYKREDAKAVFTADTQARLTKQEIDAKKDIAAMQERGAAARAAAPSADMREAMLLGTGSTDAERYLSGLKVKQALLGDKQGTQLFKMFLEENGRREKNMEKPLTLEQFRRQSAAFFTPPTAVDTGKADRS
jgi:hypothetical protein